MKIVVLGDIGGQLDVFHQMLQRIGIGENLRVPRNTIIIQIGDVVRMTNHPHIDSIACAGLADKLLRRNVSQWIQFPGNHESPFLDGPGPESWNNFGTLESCWDIVRGWWNDGLLHMAAGIQASDGEYVLTHAGVTCGYAEDFLGETTARGIVSALNEIAIHRDYSDMCSIGVVNFGLKPNPAADFMWAATGAELLPSWAGVDMGFHQVHGHDTALLSWEKPFLRDPLPLEYEGRVDIDCDSRLTTVETPQGWRFHTVDWVLKELFEPDASKWGILEFEGDIFF